MSKGWIVIGLGGAQSQILLSYPFLYIQRLFELSRFVVFRKLSHVQVNPMKSFMRIEASVKELCWRDLVLTTIIYTSNEIK